MNCWSVIMGSTPPRSNRTWSVELHCRWVLPCQRVYICLSLTVNIIQCSMYYFYFIKFCFASTFVFNAFLSLYCAASFCDFQCSYLQWKNVCYRFAKSSPPDVLAAVNCGSLQVIALYWNNRFRLSVLPSFRCLLEQFCIFCMFWNLYLLTMHTIELVDT